MSKQLSAEDYFEQYKEGYYDVIGDTVEAIGKVNFLKAMQEYASQQGGV